MKMREWEQVSQKATSSMEKQLIFSITGVKSGWLQWQKTYRKVVQLF